MTPNRPYLIRALYDWILDNDMTPHLLVNTCHPDVAPVPLTPVVGTSVPPLDVASVVP
jgi:stringent starvation protein B